MTREKLLMLLYPEELQQVKNQIENLKLKVDDLDNFISSYFNIFDPHHENYANCFVNAELNSDKEFRELSINLSLYNTRFLYNKSAIDVNIDDINKVLDNSLLKIDDLINEQFSLIENNKEFIKIRENRELL